LLLVIFSSIYIIQSSVNSLPQFEDGLLKINKFSLNLKAIEKHTDKIVVRLENGQLDNPKLVT